MKVYSHGSFLAFFHTESYDKMFVKVSLICDLNKSIAYVTPLD